MLRPARILPVLLAALALGGASLAQPAGQDQRTGAVDLEAAGRRLVEWKCNACHRSTRATDIRRTRVEWEKTIARMVENGLLARDEELETMVAYLTSLGPPEDAR